MRVEQAQAQLHRSRLLLTKSQHHTVGSRQVYVDRREVLQVVMETCYACDLDSNVDRDDRTIWNSSRVALASSFLVAEHRGTLLTLYAKITVDK